MVGWMVIYPHVAENLDHLFSGLLSQEWKMLLTTKSCKFLRLLFNWMNHKSSTCSPHFTFLLHSLFFRCAIYRLPDMHEHITQPPVGVKFPKKVCSYYLIVRSSFLSKFCSFSVLFLFSWIWYGSIKFWCGEYLILVYDPISVNNLNKMKS